MSQFKLKDREKQCNGNGICVCVCVFYVMETGLHVSEGDPFF